MSFSKGLTVAGIITGVIILVVLIKSVAALYPTFESSAADNAPSGMCASAGYYYNTGTEVCQFNSTNTTAMPYKVMPLASIFETGGVLGLVFAAFIVIGVLAYFGLKSK